MPRFARLLLTSLVLVALAVAGAGAQAPSQGSPEKFQLAVVQYYLDTAGFHGLAESLATTKKIDPATVTPLTRVKKVLDQAVWPESLKAQSREFLGNLDRLVTALKNKKVDDAIKAADLVHEEQHALSKAIDAWLVQN